MFVVEAEIRIGWVSQGGGNTFMGQFQANVPGQGQGETPRVVFQSQVWQGIVAEPIPGLTPGSENAIAISNVLTALSNIAVDFAGSGTPIVSTSVLALIAGWASGSP